MEDYTKGGRGKIAPYQTTHCRVPEPVKHLVEQISTIYKRLTGNSIEPHGQEFIANIQEAIAKASYPEHNPVNKFKTKNEAIEIAKKILANKKSAKISMAKLLSEIYDTEVKPEDL